MGQLAFVVSTVAAAGFISFSQTVRSIPLSFVCVECVDARLQVQHLNEIKFSIHLL